ncbi:hypothetical protein DSC45_06955 [Streptomyces sp. YIM 130001]|uniref:hypothetical protein n=1 Tax=Streptomyces sp. YIM 130001 TaxID=2259644 RepID=UPI000ED36A4E|nr:hypothetical protein [Streptomyces sp. YIM 130001]RII19733.1 hypothetical protein DSC45_06955 [Streptomyces sp. YIM 130001]
MTTSITPTHGTTAAMTRNERRNGRRQNAAASNPGTLTKRLLAPLGERPFAERWTVRLAAAVAAGGAYLLFLPWDLRNRAASPGVIDETTPVTATGVVGLSVVLLLLAAYLGRRDRTALAVPLVAVPPTALLLASFATHPVQDAAVWPVAWVFFGALFAAGAFVAARVGAGGRS